MKKLPGVLGQVAARQGPMPVAHHQNSAPMQSLTQSPDERSYFRKMYERSYPPSLKHIEKFSRRGGFKKPYIDSREDLIEALGAAKRAIEDSGTPDDMMHLIDFGHEFQIDVEY